MFEIRTYEDKGDKDIVRYVCIKEVPAVFRFIYYENNSKIGSVLHEVLLNDSDMVLLEPPNDGGKSHEICVNPGERAVFVFDSPYL